MITFSFVTDRKSACNVICLLAVNENSWETSAAVGECKCLMLYEHRITVAQFLICESVLSSAPTRNANECRR